MAAGDIHRKTVHNAPELLQFYRQIYAGDRMTTDLLQPAFTFNFSTNNLPGGHRPSALRDSLAEMMRVELTFLDLDRPFQYASHLRVVEGASWGSAYSSPITTSRTNLLTKDGQDDLLLIMAAAGMIIRAPGKPDLVMQPGDAALVSQAREMQIVHHDASPGWAVSVPWKTIARLAPGISSAPILRIRSGTPMLSLLHQYGLLLEADPLAGNAAQQMAARHLQEMLALIVGTSTDFQEYAEQDTVAAARLVTAKAQINENLGNTNLGLKWIAARQGVTPRHLQRLFAQEGTSFSDALRLARLERARALLDDPLHARRTILSIALECGFPEASALNRAFRKHYGITPTEARESIRK